jgi:hypothetical protein
MPGSWATPALPPLEAPVEITAEPPPAPEVQLGFADGSLVGLDATHPSARALRAVADMLVQDSGKSAENSSGPTPYALGSSRRPAAEGS